MHMSVAQWAFWIIGFALQLLLMAILLVRKGRSQFPIFFNYVIFYGVVSVVFLIAARQPYAQYFYTYWTITALGVVFGFGVLYEAFGQIMKPYSALADLAKMIFVWAGGFLMAISFLTALTTGGTTSDKICAAILLANRCVLLMQCGLFLLLLVFEKRIGVSWVNRGMCISLGLGMSAVLQLSTWYLLEHFPSWRNPVETTSSVLSIGILTYWAFGLVSAKSATKTAGNAPNRLVLQRWNDV
ncbi:MAG TPA: hypothetical protein VN176_07600, partial [Verrucomicrobiae bacterium]|nr:hypothetical protein [Verrucomicrobiae bacterium]